MENLINEIKCEDAYQKFYSDIDPQIYNIATLGSKSLLGISKFILDCIKQDKNNIDIQKIEEIGKIYSQLPNEKQIELNSKAKSKKYFSFEELYNDIINQQDSKPEVEGLSYGKNGLIIIVNNDKCLITATPTYLSETSNFGHTKWCTASDTNGNYDGYAMFCFYTFIVSQCMVDNGFYGPKRYDNILPYINKCIEEKKCDILYQIQIKSSNELLQIHYTYDGEIQTICDKDDIEQTQSFLFRKLNSVGIYNQEMIKILEDSSEKIRPIILDNALKEYAKYKKIHENLINKLNQEIESIKTDFQPILDELKKYTYNTLLEKIYYNAEYLEDQDSYEWCDNIRYISHENEVYDKDSEGMHLITIQIGTHNKKINDLFRREGVSLFTALIYGKDKRFLAHTKVLENETFDYARFMIFNGQKYIIMDVEGVGPQFSYIFDIKGNFINKKAIMAMFSDMLLASDNLIERKTLGLNVTFQSTSNISMYSRIKSSEYNNYIYNTEISKAVENVDGSYISIYLTNGKQIVFSSDELEKKYNNCMPFYTENNMPSKNGVNLVNEIRCSDAYQKFYSDIDPELYQKATFGNQNLLNISKFILDYIKQNGGHPSTEDIEKIEEIGKIYKSLDNKEQVEINNNVKAKKYFSIEELCNDISELKPIEGLKYGDNGLIILYEDNELKVTCTPTYESNTKNFGYTRWCTASDNYGRYDGYMMFCNYSFADTQESHIGYLPENYLSLPDYEKMRYFILNCIKNNGAMALIQFYIPGKILFQAQTNCDGEYWQICDEYDDEYETDGICNYIGEEKFSFINEQILKPNREKILSIILKSALREYEINNANHNKILEKCKSSQQDIMAKIPSFMESLISYISNYISNLDDFIGAVCNGDFEEIMELDSQDEDEDEAPWVIYNSMAMEYNFSSSSSRGDSQYVTIRLAPYNKKMASLLLREDLCPKVTIVSINNKIKYFTDQEFNSFHFFNLGGKEYFFAEHSFSSKKALFDSDFNLLDGMTICECWGIAFLTKVTSFDKFTHQEGESIWKMISNEPSLAYFNRYNLRGFAFIGECIHFEYHSIPSKMPSYIFFKIKEGEECKLNEDDFFGYLHKGYKLSDIYRMEHPQNKQNVQECIENFIKRLK